MQSNKASKKTSKAAEQSVSPVNVSATEATPKPRAAKSSQPKSESGETVSAKRHRKAQPAVPPEQETSTNAVETVSVSVESPLVTAGSPSITEDDIRRLAYRLWMERGRAHGSPHDDWSRAERELGVTG